MDAVKILSRAAFRIDAGRMRPVGRQFDIPGLDDQVSKVRFETVSTLPKNLNLPQSYSDITDCLVIDID